MRQQPHKLWRPVMPDGWAHCAPSLGTRADRLLSRHQSFRIHGGGSVSIRPKEKKKESPGGKSWPRAIGWSLFLVAIIGLPVLCGVMNNATESPRTQSSRPTKKSSPTRTPAPSPTLTIAQWESKFKSISYDALARSPASHESEVVRFRGQVAHIASETSENVEL